MANDLMQRPAAPDADGKGKGDSSSRRNRISIDISRANGGIPNIGNGSNAARARFMSRASGSGPKLAMPAKQPTPAAMAAANGSGSGSSAGSSGGSGSSGSAASNSPASDTGMPTTGVPGTPDGPPIGMAAGGGQPTRQLGVPGTADGPPLESGDGDAPQMSPMSRQIRDQENAAATGKPSIDMGNTEFGSKKQDADPYMRQSGKSGDNDKSTNDKLNNFGDDVRKKLKDKESDSASSFYKPGGGGPSGIMGKIQGKLKQKAAVWIVSSIVAGGGGGGFAFAVLQGPLEFLHQGALLSQFHLDEKNQQADSRLLKLARNIQAVKKNQKERTRMNYLGNKIADKIEAKMNSRGVTSVYENGEFRGYVMDLDKLPAQDYAGLKDTKRQTVQDFLKTKYNITAVPNGTRGLLVPPTGSYFADKKLMSNTIRFAGYGHVAPLQARFMGVRAAITWHPIKKLNEKFNSLDEMYRSWAKEQYERIKNGVRTYAGTVEPGKDAKGNPIDDGGTQSTIDELNQLGNEANSGLAGGDTGGVDKVKTFLEGKFGAANGAANIIGILCLIQAFAAHLDEINFTNVILPMIRMGMQRVSLADQIKQGKLVDERQLSFFAKQNQDSKTKTVWSDARSVQAELGKPLSGPDIPASAKLNKKGNVLTRMLSTPGVGNVLGTVCTVLDGPIGFVLLGIQTVIAPVATIAQFAIGAVTIGPLMEMLANIFAANAVPALAGGADAGNFWNYGVMLAANDVGTSRGGLPMSKAQSKALADATRADQQQDFNDQSLVARVFDAENPRSFVGQVLDKQSSDPGVNASRMATGLLNLGNSFGSVLARPFTTKASAAALNDSYDYGIDDVGFSLDEMNDKRYEDGYENANRVADILDANDAATNDNSPDNYVYRAKVCFGVDIVKTLNTTPDGQLELWAIKPPVTNQLPLQKDVINPANKCLAGHPYTNTDVDPAENINIADPNHEWSDIRIFIFDSQITNALTCYESDDTLDADTKQACIDAGLLADPNAGQCSAQGDTGTGSAAGGSGTGTTGTTTGTAGQYPAKITNAHNTRWKVTLPAMTDPNVPHTENGGAPEVKEPTYLTFSDAQYFHLDSAGSSVIFKVPFGANTSKSSQNPRSELREYYNNDPEGYWPAGTGEHIMQVSGQVDHLPPGKPQTVIGQVHDHDNDISVWRVEGHPDGKTADLYITNGNNNHAHLVTNTFQLGKPYILKYDIKAGVYSYYFKDGTYENTHPGGLVDFTLSNSASSYFKAGNYMQANPSTDSKDKAGDPEAYAQVQLTNVFTTHDGSNSGAITDTPRGGAGAVDCGSSADSGAAGIGATAADCTLATVKCLTADQPGQIDVATGQTLDCGGHKVTRVNVKADNAVVQNCMISGAKGEGIQTQGKNNTIQHNDISQVSQGDDGDINAITFFGDGTKLLSNKLHDIVAGAPGTSHTDCMQTWATPSYGPSSSVTISGNRCEGPEQSNPGYIHQCVMAEGPRSTDGGGGASGTSKTWTVSSNYCKTYGNQAMKFDDIQDVIISKNTFDGAASTIIYKGNLSTVTFSPDNTVTGKYGSQISLAPAPLRVAIDDRKRAGDTAGSTDA